MGSISLLADNVSNGIELVFDFTYNHKVFDAQGSTVSHTETDFEYLKWIKGKKTQ